MLVATVVELSMKVTRRVLGSIKDMQIDSIFGHDVLPRLKQQDLVD